MEERKRDGGEKRGVQRRRDGCRREKGMQERKRDEGEKRGVQRRRDGCRREKGMLGRREEHRIDERTMEKRREV